MADIILNGKKVRKLEKARKKLGDILLERGLITSQQLNEALQAQANTGVRIGETLVKTGVITEDQLVETIAQRLSIPKISLNSMVVDPAVMRRVPVEVARRYNLVPIFAIGNTLTLAMEDPLNIIAIDEVRYLTGCDIKRAIATAAEIKEAITEYYSVADSMSEIIGSQEPSDLTLQESATANPFEEAESPVVKLVNLIITKAVKAGASDIHIEPDENTLRVRYRISGVMRQEADPPNTMQNEVISRVKVAANLDVSEKRLPQDGRFMMKVDGSPIDMRVSTLPTIHGEKIVIRILDRRNLRLSFSSLGFRPELIEAWRDLINKPEGLVLISGPTSSGKTSTLYSTLLEVNSIEKNIITVEDPVEFSLPLINQMQINEKAGLTFVSTLRSILRQNPDIIMIGEIRDTETARMAIRSALTGHLVFSTVHTNDAASAITRLVDMGLENYLVSSALQGLLAQRLVRVNCPKCLVSYEPSPTVLKRAALEELSSSIDFRRGKGCTQCKGTGFAGQTGIFEFIKFTPMISDLVLRNASLQEIREVARNNGFLPLFEAGLAKIVEGSLCLEELLKETSNIEEYFGTMNQVRVTGANPV
ncbi:MAG: Flp pilus assembly complex ATPase component TadA [Candidatus Zixiibacteriota bacterium]|nr:MAG: Flp pilus assembly complex ATPase component TadA [candidate division Zixibacteria bacterium]